MTPRQRRVWAALASSQALQGFDLDFVNSRFGLNGSYRTDASAIPGWSFARASAGTALDQAGNVVQFASGVPRITDRGLLIEEARTNLLLNSAAPATQSVTVAAVAHVLSFTGTGSVTLSGVSTAGPLVGTGVNDRVSLAFTPTAGSLTLTIAGDVRMGQVEAGAYATSWVPTTGASVLRAADVARVTGQTTFAATTLLAEIEQLVGTSVGFSAVSLSDNTLNNRMSMLKPAGNTNLSPRVTVGGVAYNPGDVTGVFVGGIKRIGLVVAASRSALSGAGGLTTSVTVPNVPTNTHLNIGVGETGSGGQASNYFRRVRALPRGLSDADLPAATV